MSNNTLLKVRSISEAFSLFENACHEKKFEMAKLEETGAHFAVSVLSSLKNILLENAKKLDDLDESTANIAQVLSTLVYADLIGPLDPNFQENKQTIETLNTIMGTILVHLLSENDDIFLSTGLNLPTGVLLLQ